ncbi:hypothetical protein Tco_0991109 [Tanacetum coccineum]|uniref:Reverse transcriptase domain-containing protein n=1 Tax=Tanacetum coccineum TaxID=301880 RepID=A0ABQ5EZI3_9ASTR
MLQARENLMEAIQAFLKEYDHIPPKEKCMALLLAEERFLKIKQAVEEEHNQPEVMQDLLLKLMNDLQILNGIQPKQEEHAAQNLPTEEPDNSLIMGDEHLNTIPKTEKSSVENLVPIPSESKGISDDICDVSFCDNDHFDAEIGLINSLLSRDISITSPKIGFLPEEFVGELDLIDPILPGIDEDDFHEEEGEIDIDICWEIDCKRLNTGSITVKSSSNSKNERHAKAELLSRARAAERLDKPDQRLGFLDHSDASGDADNQIQGTYDQRGPNTHVKQREIEDEIKGHEGLNSTNPTTCPESIQAMIDQALLRNSTNGDGSHRTEGMVDLTRWIEKMESIFNISGCAIENQVKFATYTLLGTALTWWNGQIRTLGPEAYAMTWEVLKKNMTVQYFRMVKSRNEKLRSRKPKVNGIDVPSIP